MEQLTDHNKIMRQIMLGYVFRVVRMVLIIFTVSYFIGTMWFIFTWQLYTKVYDSENEHSFIGLYHFDDRLKNGDRFDRY